MVLGFAALYIGRTGLEVQRTFRLYNSLELILTARNTLVEQPWDVGAEVTLASLINIDDRFSFKVLDFNTACKMDPKEILCEDEEAQRKFFFGLTPKEMSLLKVPRARRFELKNVRSEYGGSCGAIFFRGKDEETFWIKGILTEGEVTPVQGSLIYYVRLFKNCRFSPHGFNEDAPAFFLIDLRSIGKEWYFHYAEENMMRSIYGVAGYRLLMFGFMLNEAWRKEHSEDSSFETGRFFEQLPDLYRKHFMADVPSEFLTVPVNGIESRIIGTAYMRTGTLHNLPEIDKAILGVYNLAGIGGINLPTVAGTATGIGVTTGGTSLVFWTSVAPVILLGFSFFFWYHVKRIVRADSLCSGAWVFLDTKGIVEKGFVAVWAVLLMLTPVSTTWAISVINPDSFLPIEQIRVWIGLNRNPTIQRILGGTAIFSVPALLEYIVIEVSITGSTWLIIHSLHLLLERGSVTYSRLWTRIKFWFVKLVHLVTWKRRKSSNC